MSVARIYSLHLDSFIGPFSKSTILVHWSLKPHWNETFVHNSSFWVFFCQLSLPYTVASTEWQHYAVHLRGNLYESDCILMKQHLASPSCQDDHAWFLPSKWSCWRYGSQHGGTIPLLSQILQVHLRVTLVLPDVIGPPKLPCNDQH